MAIKVAKRVKANNELVNKDKLYLATEAIELAKKLLTLSLSAVLKFTSEL